MYTIGDALKNVELRYLKQEVLAVIIRKGLRRFDDLMKISIHELINQVNIFETGSNRRQHNIFKRDHILVPHMPKKLELSQRPQSINTILKHVMNLFDSDSLVGLTVDRRADHTVSSSSNGFDGNILGVDFEQSLPHGVVMFPLLFDPVWWVNQHRHCSSAKNSTNPQKGFIERVNESLKLFSSLRYSLLEKKSEKDSIFFILCFT